MPLALLFVHAGEEVERLVVVPDVLEAEMVVLAFEAMALGGLVDAGLVAALPGAVGHLGARLGRRVPRLDADTVEELGIELHQS